MGAAMCATVFVAAGPAGAAYYGNLKVDAALHAQVPSKFVKNGVKVAVFNDWAPDEFVQGGNSSAGASTWRTPLRPPSV